MSMTDKTATVPDDVVRHIAALERLKRDVPSYMGDQPKALHYQRLHAGLDAGIAALAKLAPEPVEVGLVEELTRLHNEARGAEFDLVPADGPIARLVLFMHEHGDGLIAALTKDSSHD